MDTKLRVDTIDFEVSIIVDNITVVNSKVEDIVPFGLAVNSSGDPISAFIKEKRYKTVASITNGDVCIVFSSLYKDFMEKQRNLHWKVMQVSFDTHNETRVLQVTGTAYGRDQYDKMLDFIESYLNLVFSKEI